jgi:small subunit ribosomal protein S2
MMTNYATIQKSITKMKEIEVLKTNPNNEFTKKELLKLTNKHIKLVRSLSGISEMQKAPDLVFVIDTKLEHIAIAEARTLKIPVVGIIDTNCDPDLIDFPIPGNDDSRKSINLYCRLIREAINNSAGDISFDETPKKIDESTVDEISATKNKEGA